MQTQSFKNLLSNSDYLAFENLIKEEISRAKDKAVRSIGTDTIDIENANRAKFYEEILNIPHNRIIADKINS